MGSSELMYGADELPLMLDQSVFSIRMRNTVRMADVGSVVVVVGGRVVVVVVMVVGGRVVVVVVVVVGGRVVVVVEVGVGGRVMVEVACVGGLRVLAMAGVHWWALSGELPEVRQRAVGGLVPLVVASKVPPGAGRAVAVLRLLAPGRVVVVVGVAPGAMTVRLNVPCAPP